LSPFWKNGASIPKKSENWNAKYKTSRPVKF
jgi:hypothetical protein